LKQLDGINRILCIVVLCALLATSCYEDQEGCLDILATNYNVGADTACEDCCTYPSLVLELSQVNGDEAFRLGDTIINNMGVATRLIDLVYYVSEVQVELMGDDTYVADTMQVVIPGDPADTIAVVDDAVAIKRSQGSYEIGEMRGRGQLTRLAMTVGLPAVLDGNMLIVELANDLSSNRDSLRSDDNRYMIQRLILGTGPELTDTISIEVEAQYSMPIVPVALDTMYMLGADKRIPMQVDYSMWFDDIEFDTIDPDELQRQLVANMTAAFSLQ